MLPSRYPTYSLTLPLANKKVKYRPYTIPEEAKLMTVMELNDPDTTLLNITEVIEACTFNSGIASDLTIPDLAFLFMNIKARSEAKDIVKLQIIPDECEDEQCPLEMNGEIDLNEVPLQFYKNDEWQKVSFDNAPKNSTVIELFEGYGAEFRIPKLSDGINPESTSFDDEVQAKCLVQAYDGDKVYSEFTYEEALEYVKTLDAQSKKKVLEYFSGLPRIKTSCKFTCGKCNREETVGIDGISYFFD